MWKFANPNFWPNPELNNPGVLACLTFHDHIFASLVLDHIIASLFVTTYLPHFASLVHDHIFASLFMTTYLPHLFLTTQLPHFSWPHIRLTLPHLFMTTYLYSSSHSDLRACSILQLSKFFYVGATRLWCYNKCSSHLIALYIRSLAVTLFDLWLCKSGNL